MSSEGGNDVRIAERFARWHGSEHEAVWLDSNAVFSAYQRHSYEWHHL
jgi:hypothetical protein